MSLFGLGNPLLDISVNAGDELFNKYDLKPANAILAEDKHLPLYDEIQAAPYTPEYVAGGSAQNSIRVAQWMLQKEGATAYTGCVGDDATAATLRACCSKDGVNPVYAVSKTHRTGRCAVLIKDHDRSMCTDLQAASTFKVEDLEASRAIWEAATHYIVEGYFLTVSQDSVLTLAKHAMANNKIFAFSLSAPFICQFFTEGVKAVLEYSNIVVANETEAEEIAKALGYDLGNDYGAIAKKLAEYPFAAGVDNKRKVIITCGSQDVVIAYDGAVTHYPVPPMKKEEMVDTNGAGDAFLGSFVAALMLGKDDAKAVEAGCYGAQAIIRISGTQLTGKPTFNF
eukprot:UN01430